MTGARAAVFFDLHGTLGDVGGDAEADFYPGFAWYPNAAEAVRMVNDAELLAVVVTNQGPIAHGRFTLGDFWRRMTELESEMRATGARLDAVYVCPHSHHDGCGCCKPRTALVERACAEFDIDPRRGYVIGDRGDFDMLLAAAVGARPVLVRTGAGELSLDEFRTTWEHVEPAYVATDVLDAVRWVLRASAIGL